VRILHAIVSLDLDRGGPPRSTHALCVALARTGADVRLLTSDLRGWPQIALQRSNHGAGSIEVVCAAGADYLRRGRSLLDWADIVHMQSVWKLRHVMLAAACHHRGVPYILAPRGELDVGSMQQKAWKKRAFMAGFGRRMIRQAAALHLLNENEAKGVDALGISHRRFVIPNGIDASEWQAPLLEPPVRQQFPQIGSRTIVLFFARMHRGKGGALLAQAFAAIAEEHPDSFLIFAGPDYGEKGRIERILAASGLSSRSLVLEALSGEHRRRMLMDADIVALPSSREAHPRVVLEAALLGKSLLISRECHVPELTDSGAAQVVELSVDAVASGLAGLLDDPSRRRDLGARAAEVILSKYTSEIVAQRQMEVYREVVDDRRERTC
jgi:glycosyltransferase involved in cell wall biosynthesis